MRKNTLRNQKGFTLIEIIAVLVILGILAAVAIPKYFDLQDDARNAAAKGALGAAAGSIQMVYAKKLISGTTPAMSDVASSAATDLGDFTASYTAVGSTGVTAVITAKTGTTGTPKTKTITLK